MLRVLGQSMDQLLILLKVISTTLFKGVARTLKKGDYWVKQWFCSIVSLFKMGTSLKGKNLLPEEVNFFLKEQLQMVWKITYHIR